MYTASILILPRGTIGPPAKRHLNGVFAGGPIVAHLYLLTRYMYIRALPSNSFKKEEM